MQREAVPYIVLYGGYGKDKWKLETYEAKGSQALHFDSKLLF